MRAARLRIGHTTILSASVDHQHHGEQQNDRQHDALGHELHTLPALCRRARIQTPLIPGKRQLVLYSRKSPLTTVLMGNNRTDYQT